MIRSKLKPALLCMTATLTLGLAACGGNDDGSGTAAETSAAGAAGAKKDAKPAAAAPTLAEGPDVCFRAIAKHWARIQKFPKSHRSSASVARSTAAIANPRAK